MGDRPKVGEILVQAGIIDELQLASALGEQARWGRRLGMTLIKLGMVQEGQLIRALARQYDLPVASLTGKKIPPEVIALVPAKIATSHCVVPLFVKKEGRKTQLFLGMEEPSDLVVLDDLAFRTGMMIRPVMVGPSEIGEALDRYYAAKPDAKPTSLPDPMRGADTLGEASLRSLREEAAPTLSALLRPGPVPVEAPDPGETQVVMPPAPVPLIPIEPESRPATPVAPAPIDPVVVEAKSGADVSGAPIAVPTTAAAQVAPIDATPLAPVPAVAIDATPNTPVADPLAAQVARAIDESERTRLVAKAMAHLLIEKGILTLDEIQARVEKMKPTRPDGATGA